MAHKNTDKELFSGLAKFGWNGVKANSIEEVIGGDFEENGEDDEEEKEMSEKLMDIIFKKTNACHPMIYDTYDLCELQAQGRLDTFKVTMLKETCKYFELNFSSKAKKIDLINIICSFVEKCSCGKVNYS